MIGEIRKECMNYTGAILEDAEENDELFKKSCVSKAMNIFNSYIEMLYLVITPVKEMPMEYYVNSFKLFLYAYLTDSAIDLKDENPWLIPVYAFLANRVFADVFYWAKCSHSKGSMEVFSKLYKRQISYQVIEKTWEFPSNYVSRYGHYFQYFEKEVLLLFPVISLSDYQIESSALDPLVKAVQQFYSITLAYDDILDIPYDIKSMTLTPIIAKYYAKNHTLPDNEHQLKDHIPEVLCEISSMEEILKSLCENNNINPAAFTRINKLKQMWDTGTGSLSQTVWKGYGWDTGTGNIDYNRRG